MKKLAAILYLRPLFFLFILTILLGSCCNRNVYTIEKDSFAIVLLEENLDEDYILKSYTDFVLHSVKKSSKSQNQYQCHFTVSDKQLGKLLDQLSKDENIIHYDILEITDSKATNSTNDNYNKTGPIKD